jgi:hypothetical protein
VNQTDTINVPALRLVLLETISPIRNSLEMFRDIGILLRALPDVEFVSSAMRVPVNAIAVTKFSTASDDDAREFRCFLECDYSIHSALADAVE